MSEHGGFLGPQSMWLGLGVAALALIGWKAFVPAPDANKEPVALRNVIVGSDARTVQLTRTDCLRLDDRVWVTLDDGVECIASDVLSRPAGKHRRRQISECNKMRKIILS